MKAKWHDVWQQKLLKKTSRRYRRLTKAKLLSRLAIGGFVGFIALLLVGTIAVAVIAVQLPQPDKIVRREGFSTKIFDRNGNLLYDVFADQRRTPVKLEEMPLYLRQATIAIEDKNFYQHSGFDPFGMFRAVYNIVVHHKLQGGSTLTQQLVKNVLLTSHRTIDRKIREFILAVQIENKYSKDEILQMYLNEAPYGGTAWGVEVAAETYFGKKANELTLVESAILAGLPQRPSAYSPFGDDPKAYTERTKVVLRRMREDDYISGQQEEEAVAQLETVEFSQSGVNFKAPHFVMYVKRLLEDRYGASLVEQGGLKVTTSLDLDLQEKAQAIVAEEIEKVEAVHITNGAAVVLDPATGEILAMVGSKDYNDPDYDGKVNVTLALRQPGSSIKPVTYLTGLKKGYTASTMIMDTPAEFPIPGQPNYKPVNYTGDWHGPMQVRYALGNSINMTAVKMLAMVGIPDMLETAYAMGLTTLEPTTENLRRFGLALTLGGGEVRLLEMAAAYSAFANTGLKVEPVAVLKVETQNGEVLEEFKPVEGKRVISGEEAYIISDILSDNSARQLTFGATSYLTFNDRAVAVKTGTTNDKRDNWTIGWTPQVMVGVWVGNNDNSQMKQVASGVSGASPIWRKIIIEALKGKPTTGFSVPDGVVTMEVDRTSGYQAHDDFAARSEYFVKGTEPNREDPIHLMLKLCKGQEKLATQAMIARGDFETKEYFVFKEEDLVSTDGVNRWQTGIDQWVAGQGDARYRPPTEYCGDTDEIFISVETPGDREQINSNEVQVKGKVTAPNKISLIEILVDGTVRESLENTGRFDKIFTLETGTYEIRVRARDEKGKQVEATMRVGVRVSWDWSPSPTPGPTSTPTAIPSPTISLSP